jgi:type II secretion system protein J
MDMNRDRKPTGFTLVEMLVALAIFGTVMAGISVVFISSMRAWQTNRENQSVFEMGRAALNVMEQDLTSAFGSVDRDEMQTLVGGRDWLTFVGMVENPLTRVKVETGPGSYYTYDVPHSDMSRVTYCLLGNPAVAGEMLLLRLVQLDVDGVGTDPIDVNQVTFDTVQAWEAIIENANPEMLTDPELYDLLKVGERHFELASNILGLEFYYGAVNHETGQMGWSYTWDSRERVDRKLPDVIEVRLSVRAEVPLPTPETKVRVFRTTIFLPLGYRRPLPAALQ